MNFGTDGIRGVANDELTAELSLSIGRAAVSVFGTEKPFIVGRDTRLSGPMIQAALSAGIASAGGNVVDLGVLPTPALAFASAKRGAPAAVVSASHNPYSDNGIKFFAPGGAKLSDETERQLEEVLKNNQFQVGGVGGSIRRDLSVGAEYIEFLLSMSTGLGGMRIVVDCAHGAASAIAPELFRLLGADVTTINAAPDGRNINDDCGSTHMDALRAMVATKEASVGLAFDGDADRVLAVDETGQTIDGDQIMAMLAIDAKKNGQLKDDTVVVTVMSNLGLRLAMERNQIDVHETSVGDRHVLAALKANGWSLGGEQSGHIIFPELATTGDGLLTGIKLLDFVHQSKKSLSELSSEAMTKLPQKLHGVKVKGRSNLDIPDSIWEAVHEAENELGTEGRVLLRASGTEPLIRVMVEAPSEELANDICERLSRIVEKELA